MNNRRIILIILAVLLLLAAAWGMITWLENTSRNTNLKVDKISTPPVGQTAGQQNVSPAPANISEEAIQQKIEEKKEKLKVEAADRPYNASELDFINNPRQAVINELSQ